MGGSRTDTHRRPMLRLFGRSSPRPSSNNLQAMGGSEDPAMLTVPSPDKPDGIRDRCRSVPNLHLYSQETRTRQRHVKRVSFTALEVREYNICVGDHPCCQVGVPISLGWDYEDKGVIASLEDYELMRCPRRDRVELRKSAEERRQMLVNAGAPEEELRKAQRQLQRARSCSAKLSERMNETFFAASIIDSEEE
ncbi:hypothetical protein MPSEU_000167700 [Mayamaea pseudoterrestris]|nr:hypothetical protein MPSEU_000167700 [Mayamaea pseudoterrestris]